MKTIIFATTLAIWAALMLGVAPTRAIAALHPCDALGLDADFDCGDTINPSGPMRSAPPPSNPSPPTHVHCDCVRLVDGHTELCCP